MKKSVKTIALICALAAVVFSASACQSKAPDNQSNANNTSAVSNANNSQQSDNSQPDNSAESKDASTGASETTESSAEQSSQTEESSAEPSTELSEVSPAEISTENSEVSPVESLPEISIPEVSSSSSSDTLRKFLTPDNIAAIEKSYSNDVMNVTVEVEDNNRLVMKFTLKSQLDITDAMLSQLENSINQNTMSSAIDSIEKGAGVSGITLSVRFFNADGSLIFEKDFVNTSSTETSTSGSDTTQSFPDIQIGQYKSLDEFFANPEIKAAFDSQAKQYSNSLLDTYFTVENGSQFVYNFKYKSQAPATDSDKKYLDTSLESNKASYNQIANLLQTYIVDNSITVVVRYINADNTVIIEKQFNGN